MTKPIKPLSEQIEEYKLQFKLYQEWEQFLNTDKTPDEIRIENNDTSEPTKEYWDSWTAYYNRRDLKMKDLIERGWSGSEWNWDESWDGQLIKDVTALEQAGFTIVSFSRKRKVTLKVEKDIRVELADGSFIDLHERANIVELVTYAVGDSWYSISFKPTLSIYWKGRSSSWS